MRNRDRDWWTLKKLPRVRCTENIKRFFNSLYIRRAKDETQRRVKSQLAMRNYPIWLAFYYFLFCKDASKHPVNHSIPRRCLNKSFNDVTQDDICQGPNRSLKSLCRDGKSFFCVHR